MKIYLIKVEETTFYDRDYFQNASKHTFILLSDAELINFFKDCAVLYESDETVGGAIQRLSLEKGEEVATQEVLQLLIDKLDWWATDENTMYCSPTRYMLEVIEERVTENPHTFIPIHKRSKNGK